MKRVLLILLFLFLSPSPLIAESPFDSLKSSDPFIPPIRISVLTNKTLVSQGGDFKLHVSIYIEEGWHIYSLTPFEGSESLATQILMDENIFKEQDSWKGPEPILIEDGAVGKMVQGHKDHIEFSKTYLVPSDAPPQKYSLNGDLVYRACDNQICTLPREFTFRTEIEVSRK